MAPLDPDVRGIVDELANALQTAVLIAEQLERAGGVIARDAASLQRSLHRATAALQKLRIAAGG